MPFPTFATPDEIPEPFRDAYEEKDGVYVAKTEDVGGLKAVLADQKARAKRAAEKAAEAERQLTELREAMDADKKGISGDKLAEIRAQAEAKFKPHLDELEATRQQLRALRLDSAVKGLYAKAEMFDPDAAWKITADEYDLTDDGKVILKADPTADLEKHITTALKAKYPFLYKGTQAAGGGAVGSRPAGASTANSKPVTQWTPDEKQAYREQHGEDSIRLLLEQHLRDAAKPKAA